MAVKIREKTYSSVLAPTRLPGRETFNTFRAEPVLDDGAGNLSYGKNVVGYSGEGVEVAKKNAAVLERAFVWLADSQRAGNNYRLIIPVNSYSLVSNESATILVGAIKKLPKELRPNVIVELYDFPPAMTLNLLEEIIIPLFAFFETFIASPDPAMDDFTIFANCNMIGTSIDLGRIDQSTEAAKKALTRFWATATKARLKLFVENIRDQALLENAERYEAMGVDGELVAPFIPASG